MILWTSPERGVSDCPPFLGPPPLSSLYVLQIEMAFEKVPETSLKESTCFGALSVWQTEQTEANAEGHGGRRRLF